MGCCSVTQRHMGTDEVGPDEIELMEVSGTGLWSLAESKLQISTRNDTDEGLHRKLQVSTRNDTDEGLHRKLQVSTRNDTDEGLHRKLQVSTRNDKDEGLHRKLQISTRNDTDEGLHRKLQISTRNDTDEGLHRKLQVSTRNDKDEGLHRKLQISTRNDTDEGLHQKLQISTRNDTDEGLHRKLQVSTRNDTDEGLHRKLQVSTRNETDEGLHRKLQISTRNDTDEGLHRKLQISTRNDTDEGLHRKLQVSTRNETDEGLHRKLQVSTRNETDEGHYHCPSVKHLKRENSDPVSARELTQHPNSHVVLWGWTKDDVHHRLYTHPIREWEGRAPHTYGDIIYSSSVYLHSGYTKAMSERYLVLFSFHLLILALDSSNHDFIYEGILPLSAIEVHLISQQDPSSPHMFKISGPMVDSKIFICASAAETNILMENIENRRYKCLKQQLSPSHSALSYLMPCDESWKREELKRYLLRSPILQWEGTPIQHMGYPKYISLVHVSNIRSKERILQRPQERLLVLFPFDLLILSIDCKRVRVKYEGRLPLKSIKASERSALPGRLEFELTGELMEPLLVSCTYPEDYQSWIFQLQQPDKVSLPHHTPPPLIPKKRRS